MILNLIQQPKQYTPAYNPNTFVLSADTDYMQYSNFLYLYDLYNDLDNSLIGRFKFPTYSNTTLSVFDASKIVSDYLSHDLSIEDEGFEANLNSYFRYKILGGIEFFSGNTTVVQYINQVTSNTITAINNILHPLDFIDYDYVTSNNNSILTDYYQSSKTIGSNDFDWLYMFSTSSTQFYSCLITGYDSNNSVVNTSTLINTYSGNTVNHYRLGVGTANLRRFISNGFIDQWSKYTVELKNISGVTTHSFTYTIDNCTGKHKEKYRFIWLNSKGGFDSYSFNKKVEKNTNIKRTQIGRNYNQFNQSNVWGYGYDASESFTNKIVMNDSYNVFSDWLTQDEYDWLSNSLVMSPVVYLQYNGKLISVTITENSIKRKTRLNDGLISIDLSFNMNLSYTRQSY